MVETVRRFPHWAPCRLEELRGDRELVLGCVQKVQFFIGQKGRRRRMTGWWFQICFIFIPIWGRFPI